MKQFRRIEPRIAYDDDVTLTRPQNGRLLFGRAVNISASGIYLHTTEPCEIGSMLTCTLLLPGGARKLTTRVVRLEALPEAIGVALAFVDLSSTDVSALRAFVARRQAQTVDARVQLAGIPAAVRCRATCAGDTIRLTTSLPFLRLDSEVGVLLEPNGSNQPRSGILSSITLGPASSDGIPQLTFDVDIGHAPLQTDASPPAPGTLSPTLLRLVRRRPSPPPLPSVVVEQVRVDDRRRDRPPRTSDQRQPRHDTAQLARLHPFADWMSPPPVATQHPLQTLRLVPVSRNTLTIAAAAFAGFFIALLLR